MTKFKTIFFICLVLLAGILAPLSATAQTDDPRVYEVLLPNSGVAGVYIYDAVTSKRLGLVPIDDIGPSGIEVNLSQTFAIVRSFDIRTLDIRFTGIQIIDLKTQKTTQIAMKGKRIFEGEFNPLNELEVIVGFADADYSNPQIGILNVATGQLTRSMPMPGFPISFTFSQTKMYVVLDQRFDQGVDRLLEMTLPTMSITRSLDLPSSRQEFGCNDQSALTPDGKLLYIGRTNQVVVVNTDLFTFKGAKVWGSGIVTSNTDVKCQCCKTRQRG